MSDTDKSNLGAAEIARIIRGAATREYDTYRFRHALRKILAGSSHDEIIEAMAVEIPGLLSRPASCCGCRCARSCR